MTRIRLPGMHRVKKRQADRQVVEYHLVRGVKGSSVCRSDSDMEAGSPEHLAAYQKALLPEKDGKKFGAVINAFFASGEIRKLAPRT